MISAKISRMNSDNPLIWLEISKSALQKNLQVFRELLDEKTALAPVVKSNAYGHGLIECGKIFREAGADYLVVNSIFEARKLRAAGDFGAIYIAGYTSLEGLREAVALDCEIVIYNRETLEKLETFKLKTPAKVHLKTETGTHRQGVPRSAVLDFAEAIRRSENAELAGVAMHFANIEDARDHSFAEKQLAEFNSIRAELLAAGFQNLKFHAANSAATLLFPETHFDLARVGIAAYGMWPSEETFFSLAAEKGVNHRDISGDMLTPALTWKTKIAQIKTIPEGSFVGYGCSFEASREMKIAILPVGYYDGYSRNYAAKAEVLIHGKRAKVVGRICMNILMADVSMIPEVKLEDEVVLLGKFGNEKITAEEIAEWGGTINYEVTTRIRENILRIIC